MLDAFEGAFLLMVNIVRFGLGMAVGVVMFPFFVIGLIAGLMYSGVQTGFVRRLSVIRNLNG